MKKLPILVPIVVLITMSQLTAQKIKNSAAYFKSPSKVGVYIKSRATASKRVSSGGLIGAALNASRSVSKYDEPLTVLEPKLKPNEKAKDLYKDIYSQKGKTVSFIDLNLDSMKLKSFESPKGGKKYADNDFRFLKERFQIDELLIVVIEYGIRASYSYGVENSRLAMCSIETEVVDLSNNSYIIRDETDALERILGSWNNPPYYEELRVSINAAIENAISKERKKYLKL